MPSVRFGQCTFIGNGHDAGDAGAYAQQIAFNLLRQKGLRAQEYPRPEDPVTLSFHRGNGTLDYFVVDGEEARFVRATYAIPHAKSQNPPPKPNWDDNTADPHQRLVQRDLRTAWQAVPKLIARYVYAKAERSATGKESISSAAEAGQDWKMLYTGSNVEATVCDRVLDINNGL